MKPETKIIRSGKDARVIVREVESIIINGVQFDVMDNIVRWAQIIVKHTSFFRGLFQEKHWMDKLAA